MNKITNSFVLNPEHIDVVSFASKSPIRFIIESLYIMPDRVVATDSYRLLEVTKPKADYEATVIDATPLLAMKKQFRKDTTDVLFEQSGEKEYTAGFKANDIVSKCQCVSKDDNFPVYQSIMPTTAPVSFVRLNAQYLKELAAFIEKHQNDEKYGVTIELYGHDMPAKFTATSKNGNAITGIIMPLRMSEEEVASHMPKKVNNKIVKPATELSPEDLPF